METNIVRLCGSRDIFLTHPSLGFDFYLEIVKGKKSKPFSGIANIRISNLLHFDFIYEN